MLRRNVENAAVTFYGALHMLFYLLLLLYIYILKYTRVWRYTHRIYVDT